MPTDLYAAALSLCPKAGPITARRLVGHFGDPESVFRASRRELLRVPGIGPELVDALCDPALPDSAQRQLDWAEQEDIELISFLDPRYPKRLRPYEDSPVMLYLRGGADLEHPRIVSVVGTRNPSDRGRAFVRQLIEGLAPYDVLIVSGMALGIDGAAHRACQELGVPTLGVLAHGLHTVFPPSHHELALEMCAGASGLLSEYPLGANPRKEFFPLRNRIVAALSDALVVVESNLRGGSMISAQLANDYQKDVFAVPGRPGDTKSEGCNHLIKTHRAALLDSAADLAELLRWSRPGETPRNREIQRQLFADLSEEESELVEWLRKVDSLSLDELLVRGRRSASALSAILLQLELKGAVKALPGKMFALA